MVTKRCVNRILGLAEKAERDGGPEYLLVYHAKGAASITNADDAHQQEEITARRNGDNLIVSVRHNGKPVPQNDVTIEWPGTEPKTIKTDAKGDAAAIFPQSTPAGCVGLRTMIVEPKAGEMAGTKYSEVHHWTTLTFPIEAKSAASTPTAYRDASRKSTASLHEFGICAWVSRVESIFA